MATPSSETMRAFVLTAHGDMDRLVYREDWPKPSPGPGQALIAVAACGLNNTDVNTRTGWYSKGVTEGTGGDTADGADDDASWGGAPIQFPRIQGADAVGRVVAVGSSADQGLVGKRVMVETWLRDPSAADRFAGTGYFGSECDGGFAEFAAAPVANVYPLESALSDAELATFATSYATAENMLARADVGEGDVVLVTGASGGVGSALIQLSHRRGAQTVALTSADKRDAIAALGCRAVLPREPQNLAAALRAEAGLSEVMVVADVVGGPLFGQLIECLARGGRYTCAGAIAGPMVTFDLRTFYLRDQTFTGATVYPSKVFADLVGYIEREEIKPLLAATYPLAELHAAQTAFLEKKHIGSIVVTP